MAAISTPSISRAARACVSLILPPPIMPIWIIVMVRQVSDWGLCDLSHYYEHEVSTTRVSGWVKHSRLSTRGLRTGSTCLPQVVLTSLHSLQLLPDSWLDRNTFNQIQFSCLQSPLSWITHLLSTCWPLQEFDNLIYQFPACRVLIYRKQVKSEEHLRQSCFLQYLPLGLMSCLAA